MIADDWQMLHAYVDGELDPANAAALEARLARDECLRARYESLRDLSAAVRNEADYHAAPPELATRIRGALPDANLEAAPRRPRGFRLPWLGQMAALATAVALGFGIAFVVGTPGEGELLARELVANHVRATLSERLIEVASSDQHTVKPWLSEHLPFSPRVADFSGDGFPLAGARRDYVDGKPAAVLVYKRRRHTIELFVWPGVPPSTDGYERDGFNVAQFGAGGLQYWAVSDLNRNELRDFMRLAAGGKQP